MSGESPTIDGPSRGESVSQAEVERLLEQVVAGESSGVGATPQTPAGRADPSQAIRHVFRKFSALPAVELRDVRIRYDAWLRALAGRLSLHLRLTVNLRMSFFEVLPFGKFLDGLSQPTHLLMVKFDSLDGICFLEIPPKLGLSFVDRELGGPGVPLDDARELNQTETRVLSQVVEIILHEWCSSWSGLMDMQPTLLGHESTGRYVKAYPAGQLMLVLSVETRIGDQIEHFQFAVPDQSIKPLMQKLNAAPGRQAQQVAVHAGKPRELTPAIGKIDVALTAELPTLTITGRQLAELKPGDLLPVTAAATNQVRVCLADTPRFAGQLGTCGTNWAVKIDQVLKP